MKESKHTYSPKPELSFQSSHIWHKIIPLPGYQFFHRPTEQENVDPRYIERSLNHTRLKHWLTDNIAKGGTYLVTGFRGAGKSSFVSHVIGSLKKEQKIEIRMILCLFGSLISFITLVFLLIKPCIDEPSLNIKNVFSDELGIGLTIVACIIFILFFLCYRKSDSLKKRFNIIRIKRKLHYLWKQVRCFFFKFPKRKDILDIKINLGQDIIHERDVLSLLAHSLKENYEDFSSKSWYMKVIIMLLNIVPNTLIAILIAYLIWGLNNVFCLFPKSFTSWLNNMIENKDIPDSSESWAVLIVLGVSLLLCGHLIRKKMTTFIANKVPSWFTYRLLVIEKLSKLCERIDASVSTDHSVTAGSELKKWFSFSRTKKTVYPIANEKEIERELKSILQLIQKSWFAPQIVIIFDELDKVDTSTTKEEDTVADGLPEFERTNIDMIGGGSARRRKRNVLSLIANMKFFLSSADAFFIFIAGRELYDAWLADITDRDFTVASIFNGVINVDSFFHSSRSNNDVTKYTEEYLCRYLLPESEAYKKTHIEYNSEDEWYTLRTYRCYIEKNEEQDKQEVFYTIQFLYKLVVYLTFLSNGSPKKLANLIQQYVCSGEYLKKKEDEVSSKYFSNMYGKQLKKHEYYLSFGFYEQQKIGFIYYLISPVMQAIVNRSNMFGDKLLVSASFIIGHIFKHFNNGFTWQHLEQTPELLDINKTPELREYMSTIIDFMSRTHISPILCSVYTYKFPLKISEEIAYHSKLSQEFSALFNSSLDSSLLIKRHYMKVLDYYAKLADKDSNRNVYAMSRIHRNLGDIYMMEEDYSKAIWEFQYAIKMIEGKSSTSKAQDTFFRIRTMLKLGLAYEKRHTEGLAFVTYTEIIRLLMDPALGYLGKDGFGDEINFIFQPLIARLACREKTGTEGITDADIRDTIEKYKDIERGLRHSMTKNQSYYYMAASSAPVTDAVNDPILAADFYRKLGDVLYMKNYQNALSRDDTKKLSACAYRKQAIEKGYKTPCCACQSYAKSLELLLPEYANPADILQSLYNDDENTKRKLLFQSEDRLVSVAMALEGMGHSLYSCANEKDEITIEFLRDFFEIVSSNEYNSKWCQLFHERFEKESLCGRNLEKVIVHYWCAAYLYEKASRLNEAVKCYKQILQLFRSYMSVSMFNKKIIKAYINEIERNIVRMALIRQYAHYENSNMCEIQQSKWIYGKKMYEHIPLTQLSVFPDIEELLYLFYMVKHQCEWPFENDTEITESSFFGRYRVLSTLTSNVYNLHYKSLSNIKKLEKMLGCKLPPFGNEQDPFYSRLKISLEELKNEEKKNFLSHLEALLVDTLFCLTQILNMIEPLRRPVWFTHSYVAEFYVLLYGVNEWAEELYFLYRYAEEGNKEKREGYWTEIIERLAKKADLNEETLEDLHDQLSGINENRSKEFYGAIDAELKRSIINYTASYYLGESAIRHYKQAIEQHTEGKAYSDTIRGLHFLDDDLHNDTCQFFYAKERYLLNCGYIEERMKKLQQLLSEDTVYKSDTYLDKEVIDSL